MMMTLGMTVGMNQKMMVMMTPLSRPSTSSSLSSSGFISTNTPHTPSMSSLLGSCVCWIWWWLQRWSCPRTCWSSSTWEATISTRPCRSWKPTLDRTTRFIADWPWMVVLIRGVSSLPTWSKTRHVWNSWRSPRRTSSDTWSSLRWSPKASPLPWTMRFSPSRKRWPTSRGQSLKERMSWKGHWKHWTMANLTPWQRFSRFAVANSPRRSCFRVATRCCPRCRRLMSGLDNFRSWSKMWSLTTWRPTPVSMSRPRTGNSSTTMTSFWSLLKISLLTESDWGVKHQMPLKGVMTSNRAVRMSGTVVSCEWWFSFGKGNLPVLRNEN